MVQIRAYPFRVSWIKWGHMTTTDSENDSDWGKQSKHFEVKVGSVSIAGARSL